MLDILYPKIPKIKLSFVNPIPFSERIKMRSTQDAYSIIYDIWDKDTIELYEEAKVIYVDTANAVLGIYDLNIGSSDQTIIDVKRVVTAALLCNAAGLIMAHNHPSNNDIASEADKSITRQISDACKPFKILLLDHLIICPEKGKYQSCMY